MQFRKHSINYIKMENSKENKVKMNKNKVKLVNYQV